MASPTGKQPSPILVQALRQVGAIESLYNFTQIENILAGERERRANAHLSTHGARTIGPPSIGTVRAQVTHADPLLAKGLEPEIWHGLGVVGLWAAIDAFRERKRRPKTAYSEALPSQLFDALGEIDDLRNLFAHNFAGEADNFFFKNAKHRVNPRFTKGQTQALMSSTDHPIRWHHEYSAPGHRGPAFLHRAI